MVALDSPSERDKGALSPVADKRFPKRLRQHLPAEHGPVAQAPGHDDAWDAALILALTQSSGDLASSTAVEARLRWHTEKAHFAQAQRLAEALLRFHPDATSTLNNLSLVASLRGRHQEALSLIERVLGQEPDNLHAHANAIRVLVLSGRSAEARARAERLLALPSTLPDAYAKKAEALSYLGDDASILALFAEAEAKGRSDGYLYHLAACAALGRGQAAEAARLWQRALHLRPDLESAAENLADLQQPAGERQGPWPFPMAQWVPESLVRELTAVVHTPAGKPISEGRLPQLVHEFLLRHPELPSLLPALLKRGDPGARQFALHLCYVVGTPELRESLKKFALGRRGSDEQRFQAAMQLVDAGILPAVPLKMWVAGVEQEILPIRYEIYTEPVSVHGPKVRDLLSKAGMALNQGDGARSESLLRKALALEPNSPDIVHNVGNSLLVQGRTAEARAMLEENHRRHPDYFFGRTYMAMEHARAARIEAAEALVAPLRLQRRLHVSEFSALMGAEVELALSQRDEQGAEGFVDQLEQLRPGHPTIAQLRRRIAQRRSQQRR